MTEKRPSLVRFADGKPRCGWLSDDPLYIDYHDREWGVPVRDDRALFELLILEGCQAGLSWITVLRKRESYRQAYDGFDAAKIARYSAARQAKLMQNEGIVRNRAKVAASVQNAQQELLAASRARYQRINQQGQVISQRIDELRRLHTTWQETITGLLTNDEGRYLSRTTENAISFRSLYSRVEPLTATEITGFEQRLNTIVDPIRQALDSDRTVAPPKEDIEKSLQELDTEVNKAIRPYRENIDAIDAFLAAAKQTGIQGDQTLAEVIDGLDSMEEQQRVAMIEDARQIAEAEATAQLQLAEQNLVDARTDTLVGRAQTQEARIRAASEAERLKGLAMNPEVQALLAPFITKSTARPITTRRGNAKPMVRWEKSQLPEPFSFQAISVYGALEPSEKGRERLVHLATHASNMRPSWAQPVSAADWQRIETIQKYLIELGPTLVEMEYLKP